MTEITDTFRGDNDGLRSSIEALLHLDEKGALVPHGIGGHARDLLSAAYVRLASERTTGFIAGRDAAAGYVEARAEQHRKAVSQPITKAGLSRAMCENEAREIATAIRAIIAGESAIDAPVSKP